MVTSVVYTDQGSSTDGTALASESLNTAVVAQAYLVRGGVIPANATGSDISGGLGVALPMPETEAVLVDTTDADDPQTTFVRMAATTLPLTYAQDNYIDLYVSVSGPVATGSYVVQQVAEGADPPPLGDDGLRLSMITPTAPGSATVRQLLTPCPVGQGMVEADAVEAQSNETLGITSTLVANLDRLRYQLGAIYARVPGSGTPHLGEWGGAGISEAWNTSQPGSLQPMVPWSMRGVANGVAELDGTGRLPDAELPLIAHFQTVYCSVSLGDSSTYVPDAYITNLHATNVGTAGTPVTQEYATTIGSSSVPVTDIWVINLHATNVGTAGTPVTQEYATTIGSGGVPVSDLWVTNLHATTIGTSGLPVTDLWVTNLHLPIGGKLSVGDLYPTSGVEDCGAEVRVHAILNGLCQVQGTTLFTAGSCTVGSLGVAGAATIGHTLGVGASPATDGQLTVGQVGGSQGALIFGPLTIRDATITNPSSLKIERTLGTYTGPHADVMVQGGVFVMDYVQVAGNMVSSAAIINGITDTEFLSVSNSVLGPLVVDGDISATVGAHGTGTMHLRRLVYDQGAAPTYSHYGTGDAVSEASWWSGRNRDNYGVVHYTAGTGSTAGDALFAVNWGSGAGTHASAPGVFVGFVYEVLPTGGGDYVYHDPGGSAYIKQLIGPDAGSGGGGFSVAFTFAPVSGQGYCIYYHVIE